MAGDADRRRTPHYFRPRWKVGALLVVLGLIAAACSEDSASPGGSPSGSTPEGSQSGSAEPFKVAYMPCGVINDQSWSQAGWEGVQEAKEALGLEVEVSESVAPADAEAAMRDYASEGFGLILAHCSIFAEAAQKVAPDFPDTWFTVNSQGIEEADVPNGIIYDAIVTEGAFTAGVLAGLTTETDKLGAIGAYNFPGFVEQIEAFRLGARFVNSKATVAVSYIDTFDDAAKAKEAAAAEYDDGADIIFIATDQAAVGVFEAASERGKYAIPQYLDQHELAPDVILTSVLYNQGQTLTEIIEAAESGELEDYPAFTPGLADGVGILAPYYDLDSVIPQDAKECVEQTQADIIAGKIVVAGIDVLGVEGAGEEIDPASMVEGGTHPCLGIAK